MARTPPLNWEAQRAQLEQERAKLLAEVASLREDHDSALRLAQAASEALERVLGDIDKLRADALAMRADLDLLARCVAKPKP